MQAEWFFTPHSGGGGLFSEGDELIIGHCLGGRDVIGEDRAGSRGALDINVQSTGFSVECDSAIGEGRTIKTLVAEGAEVIAQEVVCLDVEVVAEVIEMLET